MTKSENLGAGNHSTRGAWCGCRGQGWSPVPWLPGAGDAPYRYGSDPRLTRVLGDCSERGRDGNSPPDMQIASASDGAGAGGETNIKLI